MKSSIQWIAKLLLVAGLFYFLGKKGLLSISVTREAFQNELGRIVLAFVLLTFTNLLGIIRWHMLLSSLDIHLGFWRVIQLGLVGNFFNIALPGSVSGDLVKAVYIAKETGAHHRAPAFSSIILDRVLGLSALILVSASSFFFQQSIEGIPQSLLVLKMLLVSLALGVIVFFIYFLIFQRRADPLWRILKRLEKKHSVLGSVLRIYEGFRMYHNHHTVVLWNLMLSMLIHLLSITACIQFVRALGELTLHTSDLFTVIPLGLVTTAIPVLPAGVGTGHAAFSALFKLLGSARGADAFNLWVFFTLSFGAVGGLVYLKFKARIPKQELASPLQ